MRVETSDKDGMLEPGALRLLKEGRYRDGVGKFPMGRRLFSERNVSEVVSRREQDRVVPGEEVRMDFLLNII